MLSLAAALVLTAAPFPLPSVGSKPLAVTDKQHVFHLPMRFEKVRDFYKAQLGDAVKDGVTLKVTGTTGQRVLTLTSKRKGDTWTKATVKEGAADTVVDVTPVLRMSATEVEGRAGPLVQFVIGRSPEVQKEVTAIDHTEAIRSH